MDFYLRPFKGRRSLVMGCYEGINRFPQFAHTPKAGSAQSCSAQDAEPHLDLVQPRRVRWGIIKTHLGMLSQPPVMLGLVRVQIVQHDMELPPRMRRHDFVHEIQKFPPPPTRIVPRLYLTAGHVQGGEERAGTVPGVIMLIATERLTAGQA